MAASVHTSSQLLKKFSVGHTRQPALIFLPVIHGFAFPSRLRGASAPQR